MATCNSDCDNNNFGHSKSVSDDVRLDEVERTKRSLSVPRPPEKLAAKLIDHMLKLGYLDRG